MSGAEGNDSLAYVDGKDLELMGAAIVIQASNTEARHVGRFLRRKYGAVRADRFSHGLRIFEFPRGFDYLMDAAQRIIATSSVPLAMLGNPDEERTPCVCKWHIADQSGQSGNRVFAVPDRIQPHYHRAKLTDSVRTSHRRMAILKSSPSARSNSTPDMSQMTVERFRRQATLLRSRFRDAVGALAKGVMQAENRTAVSHAVLTFFADSLPRTVRENISAVGFGLWRDAPEKPEQINLVIHTTSDNEYSGFRAGRVHLPGIGQFDVSVSHTVWHGDPLREQFDDRQTEGELLQGYGRGKPRYAEASVFEASRNFFGTVAGYTEVDGEFYAFTCGHVLWLESKINLGWIFGVRSGRFSPHTFIHEDLCSLPLNTHIGVSRLPFHNRKLPADVAFFGPLPLEAAQDFRRVLKRGDHAVDPGGFVNYAGAMTRGTECRTIEEAQIIRIRCPDYGMRVCELRRVLIYDAATEAGDSGALIVDTATDEPVAMHTGRLARQGNSYAFAQSIDQVLSLLP